MLLSNLREEIVQTGLALLRDGVVHNGQGNISAYDRQSELVAITPSAIPYETRASEDICVVDLDGVLVEGRWKPTSELELHLIYYRKREDVQAVIHTHAPFTTVFGIIGEETMPVVLNEAAMCLGGPLPVALYARPGTKDLANITFEAIRDSVGAIMAHHGLITIGADLKRAYGSTQAAEATARCIILARSMGANVVTIPQEEVRELQQLYLGYQPQKAST